MNENSEENKYRICFQGPKLVLELEAQSPLIHFQHQEHGVTVRGSELKPKLDKFLKDKMKITDNEVRLNYKVKIHCETSEAPVEVGIRPNQYSMFYGNSGEGEEKKGIWSDPKITITCFNEELKEYIENHIVEFFYVTNFGTMQNKGFGSFIPKLGQNKPNEREISKWLRNHYGTKKCWHCSKTNRSNNKQSRCKEQFQWIKCFYGIMKSGQNFGGYERSFLFNYMHKKEKINTDNVKENINNEKAWMKQTGIAPIFSKPGNKGKHDLTVEDAKYVRTFVGLASKQQWKKNAQKGVSITIKDNNGKFERIPSPVFFKIVEGTIYFVITKIPDDLYNYKFHFNREKSNLKGNLKTPNKELFTNNIFDTERFMTEYVKYYNNEEAITVETKKDLDQKFNKVEVICDSREGCES